MPTIKIDPWPSEIEIEDCGAHHCFQLRDHGHRIYVFYHEFDEKRNLTLEISLQKAEGYQKTVTQMVHLHPAPGKLDEYPKFYQIYQSALGLFESMNKVDLFTSWEDEAGRVSLKILLEKRKVEVMARIDNGTHHIYYSSSVDTEKHRDELMWMMKEAAGLYELLKEYVKREKSTV